MFLTTTARTTADTADLHVRFAFTPYISTTPGSTWHSGEWLDALKTARILIGAGALVLPLGVHRVWIAADTADETVIDLLGVIRVL